MTKGERVEMLQNGMKVAHQGINELRADNTALRSALKALSEALADEIESAMGRELGRRDLPREWHHAQALLAKPPR